MSITAESSLHEQVLYRGESNQKWGKRSVSVRRSTNNEKCLLKVLQTEQRSLWRLRKSKKPEVVELTPNSHAVVRIDVFGKRCDVIGLLPLGDSCLSSHYFASDCREVLTNLETKLAACCDAVSYVVEIEAQQSFPVGTAFLHIFQDKICLSKNKGSEFSLLGQWQIYSHKQLFAVQGGVMLMTKNAESNESLLVLKTKSGQDIYSKFIERICQLDLAVPSSPPYDVGRCDDNSNFMAASRRQRDLTDYMVWGKLHVECYGPEAESSLEPSVHGDVSEQISSRSRLPLSSAIKSLHSSAEDLHESCPVAVNVLPSISLSGERSPQSSGRNSPSEEEEEDVKQCGTHDVEMLTLAAKENTEEQVDLKAGGPINAVVDTEPCNQDDSVDNLDLNPPPIPDRRRKSSALGCRQARNVKSKTTWNPTAVVDIVGKARSASNASDCFPILRSHSFEIVQPTRFGNKLQRHKSESSITKAPIKELVQPIELNSTLARCENFTCSERTLKCKLYSDVKSSEDLYNFKQGNSSEEQTKDYRCLMPRDNQIKKDVCETPECDCSIDSGISSEGCCDNQLTTDDDHVLIEIKGSAGSDAQSTYANLPRPSCYLYMNIPDIREAPKETPFYVNHVFKGSSVKGCYENWQQHWSENLTSSAAQCESAPEPPAPPLKPRRPPPKVPARRRSSKPTVPQDQQCLQLSTEEDSTKRSPPPRPAKKHSPPPPLSPYSEHTSIVKEYSSNCKKDIELQVAVFASKATTGQVWFLRIVVMKHSSDDATFKVVMERETACNYHLMQTQPLTISSDIVIALQHQCPLFKPLTEDSQEVDYSVIENLTHGFWFVIEFHLQHMGKERDQFVGSICVEPKDLPAGKKCPVNRRINLGITEEFEFKQQSNCAHCRSFLCSEVSHSQSQRMVISDYTKRKQVCEKLDITVYSQHNWRDVAGLLGFSVSEIHQLEDKALRSAFFSPMDNVLCIWEQRDPECNLERLVGILQQIKRFDVISELGFASELVF